MRIDVQVPERFASTMSSLIARDPQMRARFETQLADSIALDHRRWLETNRKAADLLLCEVYQAEFVGSVLSFTVLLHGKNQEDFLVDSDRIVEHLRDFQFHVSDHNVVRLMHQGDRSPLNLMKNEDVKEVFPSANRINSVLLVLGGGEVTFNVVSDAFHSSMPVVVRVLGFKKKDAITIVNRIIG